MSSEYFIILDPVEVAVVRVGFHVLWLEIETEIDVVTLGDI